MLPYLATKGSSGEPKWWGGGRGVGLHVRLCCFCAGSDTLTSYSKGGKASIFSILEEQWGIHVGGVGKAGGAACQTLLTL